jgi:hypothetical protein
VVTRINKGLRQPVTCSLNIRGRIAVHRNQRFAGGRELGSRSIATGLARIIGVSIS